MELDSIDPEGEKAYWKAERLSKESKLKEDSRDVFISRAGELRRRLLYRPGLFLSRHGPVRIQCWCGLCEAHRQAQLDRIVPWARQKIAWCVRLAGEVGEITLHYPCRGELKAMNDIHSVRLGFIFRILQVMSKISEMWSLMLPASCPFMSGSAWLLANHYVVFRTW